MSALGRGCGLADGHARRRRFSVPTMRRGAVASPNCCAPFRCRDRVGGTGLPTISKRESKDLARLSDHLIVEVPFGAQSVATVPLLSRESVRVAASMLFTPVQVCWRQRRAHRARLIHVGRTRRARVRKARA